MPAISMFYGIIIYMYFFDDRKHHRPHIHAHYSDESAIFAIDDGELLSGKLPGNKLKLVSAWIEIHKEELLADWALAIQGQQLFNIDPLK
jgi:hypothetical protein